MHLQIFRSPLPALVDYSRNHLCSCKSIFSFTPSLSHSQTHSLSRSLIHAFIYSFIAAMLSTQRLNCMYFPSSCLLSSLSHSSFPFFHFHSPFSLFSISHFSLPSLLFSHNFFFFFTPFLPLCYSSLICLTDAC